MYRRKIPLLQRYRYDDPVTELDLTLLTRSPGEELAFYVRDVMMLSFQYF